MIAAGTASVSGCAQVIRLAGAGVPDRHAARDGLAPCHSAPAAAIAPWCPARRRGAASASPRPRDRAQGPAGPLDLGRPRCRARRFRPYSTAFAGSRVVHVVPSTTRARGAASPVPWSRGPGAPASSSSSRRPAPPGGRPCRATAGSTGSATGRSGSSTTTATTQVCRATSSRPRRPVVGPPGRATSAPPPRTSVARHYQRLALGDQVFTISRAGQPGHRRPTPRRREPARPPEPLRHPRRAAIATTGAARPGPPARQRQTAGRGRRRTQRRPQTPPVAGSVARRRQHRRHPVTGGVGTPSASRDKARKGHAPRHRPSAAVTTRPPSSAKINGP